MSNLSKLQPLFRIHLFFATQAQLGNDIPLNSVLVHLPSLLAKIPLHTAYIVDNLAVLLKTAEEKAILAEFYQNFSLLTEAQLTEKWLSLLTRKKEWLPSAYQCFVESVHQNHSRIILNLFNNAKKIDPSFALKVFQLIHQKSYLPADVQNNLLKI